MKRLLRFLKGYALQSVMAPLLKFTEAVFELIVPLIMAQIIDVGIKNGDDAYIYKMGLVLIILGALGLVIAITAQYFAAKAAMNFGAALRNALFSHINSLSHAENDKLGTPSMINRMTNDVNQVQTGVNIFLRLFMRSPFIVIGSIVMSFTISFELTLIFCIASPIIALIIWLVVSKTIPLYKKIQSKLDEVALRTRENLSGVRVIRAFSRQKSEADEFETSTNSLKNSQLYAGKFSALLNPLTYVVVNVAVIAIIRFGGFSVYNGDVSQGEIIALVNYMTQIITALIMLSNLINVLTKAIAGASRINEIFDMKPSVTDDGNVPQPDIAGAPVVEFYNVTFSYADGRPSLTDVSFSADKGETVGIVGGTGSGKSTLINLIPRFYDISGGKISVCGNDIKKYPIVQLRQKIGLVPQRAVLFKGTIRDNIKWGKKDATDEEIWKALEIAQAKEFVEAKPNRLDEQLSQGGKNLSGGQRQRLTIARAIIMRPEILILDDSASALDLATDAKLRKAISAEIDSTVFIVSQRAANIRNADKIIVLDNGEVVGLGTHRQLFASCPLYREICLSQMSEKEAENA